jgi:hypothetical protein
VKFCDSLVKKQIMLMLIFKFLPACIDTGSNALKAFVQRLLLYYSKISGGLMEAG